MWSISAKEGISCKFEGTPITFTFVIIILFVCNFFHQTVKIVRGEAYSIECTLILKPFLTSQ